MLRIFLFLFCLLVAANSSLAEVGLFHRKAAPWETATEGQNPALLHLPIVIAQANNPPIRTYTMREGYEAGKKAAIRPRAGGEFLGGFVCGCFTGLIGTGVLWKMTDGNEVPFHLTIDFREKGLDYETGFREGYKEQSKREKRGERFNGGLMGTAVGVMVLLVANVW